MRGKKSDRGPRGIAALAGLFLSSLCGVHLSTAADEPRRCPLATAGKPACTIALIQARQPQPLMTRAAQAITAAVHRWSGADLLVIPLNQDSGVLPGASVIVLATFDSLGKLVAPAELSASALLRVPFLDEQGFVCATIEAAGSTRIFVVGRTPRGVYNGAVYLRDFLIDGTRENLYLQTDPVVRSPQLGGRAVYTLTIWGHEPRYTAADWETIFDSFARDGFDRVYFWLSGHFPSKKFPQTYKCADGGFDSTVQSRIGTLEDQRRIIRAAHDRGLKLYLGGALGGWCCTYLLTEQRPGTTKTPPKGAPYAGKFSLCPSHPASRQALVEYYQEMFDALPEADGVFIESADEWGACDCPLCGKTVDTLGSKQFGQSQLTLVQEIMNAVWHDHPHARLSYTIGYDEHVKDPAYYRLIREMSDPRMEWMEARDKWAFPGPEGKDRPAVCFSRQVMRWRQYYGLPLESLIKDANRVADSGFYGLITAFEPGAGTGSFYTQIPHPTDLLPYVLTGFAFREATWEPTLSVEQMRQRVRQRFFGAEAPSELAGDFWALREIIRQSAGAKTMTAEMGNHLSQIEQRITQARPAAGPKTTESLELMTRAIGDIRQHLSPVLGIPE